MQTTNEGKIKLVADIAVFCGDEVLLVKYSETNRYDHQSGWFMPDDLINDGEHPEDAAIRIVKEQLGINVDGIELGFIESFTGNDRSWHLVFHYKIHFDTKPELKKAQDIAEMHWFSIGAMPDEKEIAHHGWAKYTINELVK